jgi:membrane associated rhomboid family serine protease
VEDAEIWRLFTSMYLHSGMLHVAINMLGLMVWGWRLERDFGSPKVAAVWLISGTFAMCASCLVHPPALRSMKERSLGFRSHSQPLRRVWLVNGDRMSSAAMLPREITVGASGATCGLLGCSLAELIHNWGNYHSQLNQVMVLLLGIAMNVLVGLSPYVDNVCHISGLTKGKLLGFTLFTRRRFSREEMACGPKEGESSVILEPKRRWQWVLIFSSIPLITLLYLIAMGILFTEVDVSALCPNCYAINCVDTLFWYAQLH